MNIKIISVGSVKEPWMRQIIENRLKQIPPKSGKSAFIVEAIEVDEEKAPEQASPSEELQVRQKEAQRILAKIPERSAVIALAINGKKYTPAEMAGVIKKYEDMGKTTVCYIIGGSTGLHDTVLSRADGTFSFSAVTLPHQLAKAVLTEHLLEALKTIH